MSFFDKIKSGLTKTRDQIRTRVEWAVKGKPIDEDAFQAVEEALILSDAGVETAEMLVAALKERWKRGRIRDSEDMSNQSARRSRTPPACRKTDRPGRRKTLRHTDPWSKRCRQDDAPCIRRRGHGPVRWRKPRGIPAPRASGPAKIPAPHPWIFDDGQHVQLAERRADSRRMHSRAASNPPSRKTAPSTASNASASVEAPLAAAPALRAWSGAEGCGCGFSSPGAGMRGERRSAR